MVLIGVERKGENEARPANNGLGKAAIPCWRAILRGGGLTEVELKPGDGERVAEDDVKIKRSVSGVFVEDTY